VTLGQVAVLLVFTSATFLAHAKESSLNCRGLRTEIRAMKTAQKALLGDMVQNSHAMATTLDDYSGRMREASRSRRSVSTKDVSSLHQSAETFRSHGVRESKLVTQFNQAADELLRRVEACLQ
jgi:hypothetical protein